MISLPLRIETHDRIESTQSLMRERLAQGEKVHGLVIRALEQSAGHGQRKSDWQSAQGGSYQTLAINDEKGNLNHAFTPIAVALGLAETFLQENILLGIKWPNDLLYPFQPNELGKKLAGILCEYKAGHILIGVGMNVSNPVPDNASALIGLELEPVSATVLKGILHGLSYLERTDLLVEAYKHFDVLYQRRILINYQNQTIHGIAQGINHQGCLKLAGSEGETLICHSRARGSLKVLD